MVTPAYSWEAPTWTGTRSSPELYDEHEPLLFVCAMLERMMPRLRRVAASDILVEVESSQTPLALLLQTQLWLVRVASGLGQVRTALEARRVRRQAQSRVFQTALRLVRDELGDNPAFLKPLFDANAEDPPAVLRAAQMLVGRRLTASSVQRRVHTMQEAVARFRSASLALEGASRGHREALRQATEAGERLMFQVARHAPLPDVPFPRSAPGQADQGTFPVPLEGMFRMRHFVRLVGLADEVLAGSTSIRCMLHGRSVRQIRSEIRSQRTVVARAIERVMPVVHRARMRRLAHAAEVELERALAGSGAGQPPRTIPPIKRATSVLADLAESGGSTRQAFTDRLARLIAASLTCARPGCQDGLEWTDVVPSSAELEAAELLMVNVSPSPLAELEAD